MASTSGAQGGGGGPSGFPPLRLRRVKQGSWVVNVDEKSDIRRQASLLAELNQRREMWAALLYYPIPGVSHTRLGSISYIRDRIMSADLDALQQMYYLIFLSVGQDFDTMRKQILNFHGFRFDESNIEQYKPRLKFLNGLKIEEKQTLAFLLGVCPLNKKVCEMDIIELTLYFLMTPKALI